MNEWSTGKFDSSENKRPAFVKTDGGIHVCPDVNHRIYLIILYQYVFFNGNKWTSPIHGVNNAANVFVLRRKLYFPYFPFNFSINLKDSKI